MRPRRWSITLRKLADDNAVIYIPWRPQKNRSGGATHAPPYFLAGKTLSYAEEYDSFDGRQRPGYLLRPMREETEALLTPENRHIFLYDWALYNKWRYYDSLVDPIIAAEGWQVYLTNDHLTYKSPECANRDVAFFLHFTPQDTASLFPNRQEYGYDNLDFTFQRRGITLTDGTCIIERPLPDYDISAIRTGQYTEAGRIWEREYFLPLY